MVDFKIRVSPGQLLDRITILEIKLERFEETEKVDNVQTKLSRLKNKWRNKKVSDDYVKHLKDKLYHINSKLWEKENKIRRYGKSDRFDYSFIEVARQIYKLNDKRTKLKNKVSQALESDIKESKEYKHYE